MQQNVHHILLLFSVALFSCDRTNNDPGYDFFPDMFYSKAYETYSVNPVFEDSMTMRLPVEGTVPTDMIPYPYTKDDASRILAGRELVSPLKADMMNLEQGREVFDIYCAQCHGQAGDGKGFLYTAGLYNYAPASLINDKMKHVPDGEIYHVVTVGQNVMMEHGSIIKPEDRWKIVLYVRELQKANDN